MSHPSRVGSAEAVPTASAEPHATAQLDSPLDAAVDESSVPIGRLTLGAPPPPRSGGSGGRNHGPEESQRLPQRKRFGAEAIFRSLTTASGTAVLVIIVAIGVFLVTK